MHIIILYYLLMVTCHSQGGSYNNVSLVTTNTGIDISGAEIGQIFDNNFNLMGSRVDNGQWEVVPQDDYSWFALQLTVSKDNNWHFNPRVPSFLRFTMYGPPTTETTDESSLLLTFTDFPTQTMYFTALIQLEGTSRFNNKISTGCDTSTTPTTLFSRGSAIATTNAYGNASLRREKAGFSSSYTEAAYDWEPSQNGATADYPITFLISNYPNLNQTTIQLSTPTYTQQCNFGEAFTTGEWLAFAFSGDLANQTLFFNKFDVESWYNFTDNPTAVPTQAPTSPSQIPTQSTTDPSANNDSTSTNHITNGVNPTPTTRYPSSNPTMTPSKTSADPSAQPTQNPSTTPTSASQSPTKSPSDLPTSASQAPTKSPTNPRSGLVSVLLDDVSVQCCNGSSQQQLSVPDDTITDITYYPCCYPSDDGYFTADGDANGMTYTYSCPSAGSSISFAQMPVTVTYATGYDPNIGTACGTHQFLSDNSFLSQFNIVSLPIELHGGSYNASEWNIPSCLCSMEHPSFVAHNASECIGNPLADLCTVPSDITGYINVDITSYWSVERGECGCKYMFEYLIWEKTHVHPSVTDTIANYTLWHYIPWEVNNFTAYSREYTEQCIEVQVRICSSMCMVGVWSASNKIVDVAMTQFDTGNYLQSLATECYCYVMVDVCTFDPTASPSALPTVSPDISVTQVLESTQSLSGSNAIGIVVSVLMIMAALSWMY
eukprot:640095_1